jgi:predicted ribosomally synthesized peptide with nif11-like leader
MESAKAFMERMKNDEDFRKKVTECKDNEARKAFVLKEGFDFAVDEMKEEIGELTDEDLEGVAGGLYPQCKQWGM